MSAALISKIVNGENNVTSFTNLQQSFLQLMRSHDGVMLGNYAAGNTDMLNVLAESVVAVNYNLYKWSSAQTISVRAADGTVTEVGTAADGEYYLVAVVGADSACTMYAMPCSAVTVAANTSYAGWYIPGTQHRVVGGFVKAGAAYTRKWRYQVTHDYSNETPDFNRRVFADGNEWKANVNREPISIYTNATQTQHVSTPVDVKTFTVTCPCNLHVATNALEWGENYGNVHRASISYSVIYCDSAGNEIAEYASRAFTLSPVASAYNGVIPLTPGTYKLRMTPERNTGTFSPGTNMTVFYDVKAQTNSINVYVRDAYATPKGSY